MGSMTPGNSIATGGVMLRNWMNRQPAIVTGIMAGVIFGVLFFGVNVATGLQQVGWASAVGAAVAAVIFGVGMGLLIGRQRRSAGEPGLARAVTDAIKNGRLPANARADEWEPVLEHRRRQAKLYRWLGPVEFGLLSLLAVYLIVTDRPRVILWVAFLVFFLALAIWYPINYIRQVRSIGRLEVELAHLPPADGPIATDGRTTAPPIGSDP
ncbi:hypothetical protein ACFVWR_07005 [Leifsonia sp. NPDC058292]|uniref:hypothetical protein n=1 Tax=Leifsonia sp. NPDC058292 TaxID=3346428 RepID=UPI0036DF1A2C